MALSFYWRCEGTTLDATHDFTAGDGSSAANGSPAVSATAAKYGSNGLLFDAANERYDFTPTSIVSSTNGCVGMWVQAPTDWQPTAFMPFYVRSAASANDYVRLRVITDGGEEVFQFQIRNSGVATYTIMSVSTNAPLNPGSWYFVIIRWNSSTPTRSLSVYDSSMVLLDTVTDNTAFTPVAAYDQTDGLRFGDNAGTLSAAMWLDNIFIATNHDEPLQSNATITSYTNYGAGSTTTLTPTTGALSLLGRAATLNTFSTVTIREVFVNEAGSPVTNRTGMSLLVWYGGSPNGAPDLSISALTTDAAGTASWSLPTGGLIYNQTIFYVATDGGASLSMYTCARMIPTYQ